MIVQIIKMNTPVCYLLKMVFIEFSNTKMSQGGGKRKHFYDIIFKPELSFPQ